MTVRTIGLVALALAAVWAAPHWGSDAIAYWLSDAIGRYDEIPVYGSFRYPPPTALAVEVFRLIPYPVFLGAWTALLVTSLLYVVRRHWWLLALPPIAIAIALGNVSVLYAAVIVLGFRFPVLWAVPLLTKVTPAVGLVWFAVRRDWRALAQVLAVSVPLVVASVVLLPGSWEAWIATMRSQAGSGDPTFLPRLAAAVVLTAWGSRTDHKAVLPIAMFLTTASYGWSSLVVLLPLVREVKRASVRELVAVVLRPARAVSDRPVAG